MTTTQTNHISVHKNKHASVVKKELSEEDNARLQAIDEAITNGFRKAVQIPQLQIQSSIQTPLRSRDLTIDEEEPQREIQTERPRKHRYNINKYNEVPRETAEVEPEQVVKDTYLSHPNLEVQKFIIDTIWRCVDSRKKGEDFIFNSDNYIKLWALITQEEEKDIEVVMEEPLMRYNSSTSKKYKKKMIVRVEDVLIKNVSISNLDNVLWNSIEKLYLVNKDFVRLSDNQFFKKASLSDLVTLNTAQVITGIKSFTQPITANRIIKLGGTSNQILLANGDTIDKDQLDYEPIENARYSAIAYGMYEQRIWGYTLFSIVDNAIKPKFSGTPTNIPLNPVLFAQKVYGYPIDWTGAIAMDYYINPNGNTMALNLNSKNIVLTNITYDEAMYFLPQFDEIKYQVKEIYTYWKLSEVNVSYKSDYIQRMKERILITNPIKQNPTRIASASPEQQLEKPKDYTRRIAQIFRQDCINIITKYSVLTIIMRFTIPAMIHNVQFERKIEISQDDGDAELKTLGTATQDIGGLQQQINEINDELNRQTHFRGYYLLNTDIQQLENSANGDFAFSTESGTVWMYDQSWYNSGDIVPDQVTLASDATPLIDSGTGVAGTSTQYSRGDHQHPLQVSTVLPNKDTSVDTVGQASSYARSDHQHPIQTVDTIPVSDSADGTYGTVELYARNDHSHPINVQTNASIVPIVNGVENNGTSAYYLRHDHIHPQQLIYDGNVTATKFIKSGGTDQQILLADGSTRNINGIITKNIENHTSTNQYIKLCTFNPRADYVNPAIEFSKARYYYKPSIVTSETITNPVIFYYGTGATKYAELCNILTSDPVQVLPTDFDLKEDILANLQSNEYVVSCEPFQINPVNGCDPNTVTGAIANYWSIYKKNDGSLLIVRTSEQNTANRGLQISADGNTLSFNGSVIAGTGTTGCASNGSVNYSAGNPILWGVNSVGTLGGFYSDGAQVYWRAKPVTLRSVPP
ncbi:MAG: hypothetical protein EZS28_008482 [Streblomastix strix]|uniref:Uncharacterized protein n=1 Tax=Streblomastix strix TaxID=222440 RepID=A0A5J4WM84_9EUKA|nr:MAG: hypothetical protein EZS28_008482 [Streblomastix strix]